MGRSCIFRIAHRYRHAFASLRKAATTAQRRPRRRSARGRPPRLPHCCIAAAGYRKVMVAPAYRSQGSAWWARYQPQDMRVIDHPLGATEDFASMVQAPADVGVETHADVALNHMANEAATRPDLNYPGSAVLRPPGLAAGQIRPPDAHPNFTSIRMKRYTLRIT
ncbi:hypothetical protein Y886_16675 [Xanthomonas hyacinthi DSM 19077]|nr:hypothetical protein Y886_16675 [Xanthomonas hyacinthi DSM 19077]